LPGWLSPKREFTFRVAGTAVEKSPAAAFAGNFARAALGARNAGAVGI